VGEPLYTDVRTAIAKPKSERWMQSDAYPRVLAADTASARRSSRPAMVKAVFDNLSAAKPKNHFTVGIADDVTGTSLTVDESFDIPHEETHPVPVHGLGSDGTVSANKNSIKIIGDDTEKQRSGVLRLRLQESRSHDDLPPAVRPDTSASPYLCSKADFIACHNFLPGQVQHLVYAKPGGIFLLNSPYKRLGRLDHLPDEVEEQIIKKKIRFYVVDAVKLASDLGLGARINTIMQTCFFAISGSFRAANPLRP